MPKNKFDSIQPISAMTVESIDPVIRQFLDLDSMFGEEGAFFKDEPNDADVHRKSGLVRETSPQTIDLPMAKSSRSDFDGFPSF